MYLWDHTHCNDDITHIVFMTWAANSLYDSLGCLLISLIVSLVAQMVLFLMNLVYLVFVVWLVLLLL